ncbi:MAG TPA: hypothetical protein VK570_10910 [Rubrivivax sp.]|nr:hypothetical protein [Rubrivivax sp.]
MIAVALSLVIAVALVLVLVLVLVLADSPLRSLLNDQPLQVAGLLNAPVRPSPPLQSHP